MESNEHVLQHNAKMLSRAIAIAATAHCDIPDKGGQPYIKHPIRVMMRFDGANDRYDLSQDYELQSIAVLHDVLEDCKEWTAERFREEGFSERVVVGLKYLDHSDKRPYKIYILDMVLAGNTDAIRVKLSDLLDNSDTQRLGEDEMSDKDLRRLQKYHWSLNFLKKSLILIQSNQYAKLEQLILEEFPDEKSKLKSVVDNRAKNKP